MVRRRGYIYSRTRQCFRVIPQFSSRCGTCHVLHWALYNVPPDLAATATQAEVGEAFGIRLQALLGAHRGTRAWLRDRGVSLEPLPFRAAVYQVDTGENHSGTAFRGVARPLGPPLTTEFSVPRLKGRPSAFRTSFAPREIRYEIGRRALRLRAHGK